MANLNLQAIISAKDNASHVVGGFGASFTKLASAFAVGQLAADAFSSTINSMTNLLKSSVEAADASEFADVKMTQALKNSGKVTDEQIKSLKKYAETVQFKVGVDDENIKQGIAMMGTFKLTGATIQRTIPVLLDLAAAYRRGTGEMIDMQEWAIKIGKAESLPELATMLRRVGIVFDDNQLKMLKMANEEERVNIITKELSAEFGGQALKQADTFGGKIQILNLYFEEFKEKIGKAIINGLTPFIDKIMVWARSKEAEATIQRIIDKTTEVINKMSYWVTDVAIPWVQQHWPAIKKAAKDTIDAISLALKGLIEFAKSPEGKVVLGIVGVALVIGEIQKVKMWLTGLTVNKWVIVIAIVLDAIWEAQKQLARTRDIAATIQGPWYVKLNTSLARAEGESWISWWMSRIAPLGAIATIGGLLFPKKKQAGGYIGQTGMALVHAGELVKPAGGYAGGGETTINFYGNVSLSSDQKIDDIAKRLARQLQLAKQGAI